jgi:hypothetical protein
LDDNQSLSDKTFVLDGRVSGSEDEGGLHVWGRVRFLNDEI